MQIEELAKRKCELEMRFEGIGMMNSPSGLEERIKLQIMQIEARRELTLVNQQIQSYVELR